MTLKEKFRERLLSHLSDHNTESNADIACEISEEFALDFAIWLNDAQNKKNLQREIKQCFERFKKEI